MPKKTDGTEGVFVEDLLAHLRATGPRTEAEICEWAVATYEFCQHPGMKQLVPREMDEPEGPRQTALQSYVSLYLWLLSREKRVLKVDHQRWAYQEPMYNI